MSSNPNLINYANQYQKRYGKSLIEPVEHIPLDEQLAMETADYFVKVSHAPNDSAVRKSYNSFKNDIRKQYEFATGEMGVKFIPSKNDPYRDSAEMMKDVRENGRLRFYTGGDLPSDHPLKEVDPKTGLTYNDEFRAVHDLFGHAAHGNQFGPVGERRAFIAHSQMMEPDTVPALAFETHAQNSYFNYGPHLRKEGRIPKKGESGYIDPKQRPFAEQKANVLPSRYSALQNAQNASRRR